MPILVNIEGIAHTGILQELEMSNFDKTLPACQWDDDSGRLKLLEFLMVTFFYNPTKH